MQEEIGFEFLISYPQENHEANAEWLKHGDGSESHDQLHDTPETNRDRSCDVGRLVGRPSKERGEKRQRRSHGEGNQCGGCGPKVVTLGGKITS